MRYVFSRGVEREALMMQHDPNPQGGDDANNSNEGADTNGSR